MIAVEGAKTPAGGRDMEDPAGRSPRRLPDRPRKAKLLQRRSTLPTDNLTIVCQQSELIN
ncbi:hypothetical protein EKQ44_09415 [Sutcliffiella horikoshii]|nr:hypothetical protein [Sutcliffiella horikoshii]